jgi:hypothetical protein
MRARARTSAAGRAAVAAVVALAATVPVAAAGAAGAVVTHRALLPIRHGGRHPGAAVLAGDIAHLARARATPSAADRFADFDDLPCNVSHSASVPRYCVFGDTTKPVRTVAVVGDSMAAQWSAPLSRIAELHHWRLVIATKGTCPFGATTPFQPKLGGLFVQCHRWNVALLQHLLTVTHPDVVIASDRPEIATVDHPRGPAANREVGQGMAVYWRRLIHSGIGVVGLHETPEMSSDDSTSTPRSVALVPVTPVNFAARLVHRTAPRAVHVVHLNDLICGRQRCDGIVGNVRVYRDSHHLTRSYALTIAPYLERRLLLVPRLATT